MRLMLSCKIWAYVEPTAWLYPAYLSGCFSMRLSKSLQLSTATLILSLARRADSAEAPEALQRAMLGAGAAFAGSDK